MRISCRDTRRNGAERHQKLVQHITPDALFLGGLPCPRSTDSSYQQEAASPFSCSLSDSLSKGAKSQ